MSDANPASIQTELSNTANRLSVAAVTLAVAALVVTTIQLVLGNLVSSTRRWKTNSAAIDVSANHRAWRLAPWNMRIKIYYPQLDFSATKIFQAAKRSRNNLIQQTFLKEKGSPGSPYVWALVKAGHKLDNSHITCVNMMDDEKQNYRAN